MWDICIICFSTRCFVCGDVYVFVWFFELILCLVYCFLCMFVEFLACFIVVCCVVELMVSRGEYIVRYCGGDCSGFVLVIGVDLQSRKALVIIMSWWYISIACLY